MKLPDGWSVKINILPIEEFYYGPLLFRLYSTIGWIITGPSDILEEYADALEKDLKEQSE